MIKYAKSLNLSDCCGCRACEQICAHHAITMHENEEGFIYPALNEEACMDCGLCEKVCPMMQAKQTIHPEGNTFAAQNQNEKDLATSSSGGMFVAIAKQIIANGGAVYGAAFENGPTLCHQRITTVEGLERLKGSKYLQSDTRNVYLQVKQDLISGRPVYFVGTPCQVAGLRLFLRKDYDGLITSDFVCHGTPSNKIFVNTISHIGQKISAKFESYSFRDKKVRGWSISSSSLWKKGNKKKYMIYSKDMEAYYNAFIQGDIMRMSCYECPFARIERCSDITLADYWGVREYDPDFPSIGKGVSLILPNTEKGKNLFEGLKPIFYIKRIPVANTVKNKNLHTPSTLTSNRSNTYQLAFNNYETFVSRYYHGSYLVNLIKVHVEYLIRKYRFIQSMASSIKRILK